MFFFENIFSFFSSFFFLNDDKNNDLTKKIISVYYEKPEFAKKFEQNFISQGFESDRKIEETLSILKRTEMKGTPMIIPSLP